MSEPVKQLGLFDNAPAWADLWEGMPEFKQEDLMPWKTLKVHLRNIDDLKLFSELIGQKLTTDTKSVWYPEADILSYAGKRYRADQPQNPIYPVYIVSKGRWESRLTSKALEKIGVPYRIVIEPQEYDYYAKVIDPTKILTLPFSNLGQGSIPARNWIWEHSLSEGHKRHWILDDNISCFIRANRNRKILVVDGTIFRVAERFVDRFENVAVSGFNYKAFVPNREGNTSPFCLNTRVYSCILIANAIPYRWRGRYNEDTDLSIRALKDGYCTILFNAFLCRKQTTMTMKGGNTDELYQGDGRLKMAQSLKEQHPEIVKITTKWGRPQHHVDYSVFKGNKLKLRPDAEPLCIPDIQLVDESQGVDGGMT